MFTFPATVLLQLQYYITSELKCYIDQYTMHGQSCLMVPIDVENEF